jgi:hypothetical protein
MNSAHGNVEKYSLLGSCSNYYSRTTFGMSSISINTREILVKEQRDKRLISHYHNET